jgi:hypothetical protein
MYMTNRDDWIRTSGPFVPNEVRYQAAPHPVDNRFLNLDYHIFWDTLVYIILSQEQTGSDD